MKSVDLEDESCTETVEIWLFCLVEEDNGLQASHFREREKRPHAALPCRHYATLIASKIAAGQAGG